jgi:hypothetical protein
MPAEAPMKIAAASAALIANVETFIFLLTI